MSTHSAQTHTPSARPRRSGFDLATLLIAAVSAVVAATVVSRLWQAGTVMATAMTPVVVALVREALERPAQRVSSAARAVTPPVRRGRGDRRELEAPVDPHAPVSQAPAEPPAPVSDAGLSAMRVYRAERRVGRRWKFAIATGLLAFLIGVAVMTLPELVAGRSVVSGKHETTIFGGHRRTPAATTTPKTTSTEKKQAVPEITQQDTVPRDTTTPRTTQSTPAPAPVTPAPDPQTAPAPQATPQQTPPDQAQPAPTP